MTSEKNIPAEMAETHRTEPISIEHEMKTSYINYAMSVIIGRAIPDVRDGLKPVHRRSLYAHVGHGQHERQAHQEEREGGR